MSIKIIGVLTSGGDAPGMNAAIRSIARYAINNGIRVMGIKRGFQGLVENDIFEMNRNSVSNILMRGGTILFSARSKEFMTEDGIKKACDNIKNNNIDALITLGGDGTFRGAYELSKRGINVVGVPATIDLDIGCTEYTIGFDTAINTAMECIDKIRDTSASHRRCSIIEVMGRSAGYIAAYSAISTGAEEMLIPEKKELFNLKSIMTRLKIANKKGRSHYIIINAEGIGDSEELAKKIEEGTGIETRASILGHLQRGGSPTCLDRVHATVMGALAVYALMKDYKNILITYKNGDYNSIDIKEGLEMVKTVPNEIYNLIFDLKNK